MQITHINQSDWLNSAALSLWSCWVNSSLLSCLIRNKSWGFGRFSFEHQSISGSYLVSDVTCSEYCSVKPGLKKVHLCGHVDDCLWIQEGVEEELISCINDEGLMNISMEPVSFLINSPLCSQEAYLPRKGYFNLNSWRNLKLQKMIH